MSGTVNIPVTVQALQGVPIPSATPSDGDTLVYNAATNAWDHGPPSVPVINYVDNSGFTINQRSYASGTALGANAYGFDRWKAGASGGTLTFTPSPASTVVTITAGSILQVIEGAGLVTGTYTLSWAGTAQGRVGNGNGGLSSAYAASPLEWSATAGTNVTIEFTNGTLGAVQMQLGSNPTAWQPQPVQVELARCQRFFWKGTSGSGSYFQFAGYNAAGQTDLSYVAFPVQMRAAPTITMTTNGQSQNLSEATVISEPTGFLQRTTMLSNVTSYWIWFADYTFSADF